MYYRKIHFCSLVCPDYDMDLFPHWIRHYRAYCFDSYKVWIHSPFENEELKEEARKLFLQNGFSTSTVSGTFGDGGLRYKLMESYRQQLCPEDIMVTADSDEIHDIESYRELINDGILVIHGQLTDRWDDSLHDAMSHPSLSAQYPYEGNLMVKILANVPEGDKHRWIKGFADKIMCAPVKEPINFLGSHMVMGAKCGTIPQGHPSLTMRKVFHYTWRSSILDRMSGKTYISVPQLWHIQKFFGIDNQDSPALLRKIKFEDELQQAKGWVPSLQGVS